MFAPPTQMHRVGRLALLLLLAGQLAILAHAVADDHQTDEICVICVIAERLSAGLIDSAGTLVHVATSVFVATFAASLINERPIRAVRSRGPPHF